MIGDLNAHDKGKGRAVDVHDEPALGPARTDPAIAQNAPTHHSPHSGSKARAHSDEDASDSDDQSSHYFLSATHRQSSLPFHQNPLPVPLQSTSSRPSSRPSSPFRSSYTGMRSSSSRPVSPRQNQAGLSTKSLRSTSPAFSKAKEVERSVGTGGPIAPLPDRRYVSRHSTASEAATDPPTHHLPANFAPPSASPPPSYQASHLYNPLAHPSIESTEQATMPRSERTSKRHSPGSTRALRSHSISRALPRLDRFADPDEHWLSEGEGANMISAGVHRAVPPSHAYVHGGHDSIGSKTDSTGPSPTHSVHHQPASNFSSPPSVLATPRSTSPVDVGSSDPSLATTLAELALAIPCKACRKPIRDPTTLGCGHSICLACSLPPPIAFIRPSLDSVSATESLFAKNPSTPLPATLLAQSSNILHATTASGTRLVARTPAAVGPGGVRGRMTCPIKDCEYKDRLSTALVEPKVDYVLQKVLHLLRRDVPDFDLEVRRVECEANSEMEIDAEEDADLERSERSNSASSGGGLEETLTEEDLKRGRRSTDFKTTKRQRASALSPVVSPATFDVESIPSTFLAELQSELECQVCVQLFHEPLTTPCGHTFCSKCLARSLDHSDKCPLCRADFPSFDFFQHQPNNLTTQSIIAAAFPALAAERKASIKAEERANSMDTPIFVCTLAWPNLPTYIHIFEPRYRLMMRRVMDGDRQFGMVLPSRNDGGLSEYGTMLQVQSCNMIEDGRSIVETVGTYRFRVLEKGTYDGYTVGRIERVDDISQEQENELERVALARNQPAAASSPSTRRAPLSLSLPLSQNTSPSGSPPLEMPVELSTAELMTVCLEFVQTLRSGSAPWVLQRLNNTIGPMPTNPSDFSFWMAEVMPVDDHVKAALLQITSPRERLRLLVFWIEQFRSSWWFVAGCSLM